MTSKTIFDGVHGYTSWGDIERQIIDTPEFQRLRNIKQLGACSYVFPTACHHRFEHSLGVGHLAERFSSRLQHKQPELALTPAQVRLFKIAGLCHDLGHGPLSHGFDTLLAAQDGDGDGKGTSSSSAIRDMIHHEARSVALFRYIVQQYSVPLTAEEVDIVCELILPRTMTLPPYWYQMIANVLDGIDVDKFDYLKRDCRAIGLSSGIGLDAERFFEYARVIDGHICYPTKMQFDVHELFALRARLHAQVYQHPVVRGIEWMHVDYLAATQAAWRDDVCVPPRFAMLTDVVFRSVYLESVRDHLTPACYTRARQLLHRIARRELYHFVGEVLLRPGDTLEALAIRAGAPSVPHELSVRCEPMRPPDDNDNATTSSATDVMAAPNTPLYEVLDASTRDDNGLSPLLFDCVHIGYATNPIRQVRFYDRSGAGCAHDVALSTLCTSSCDVYLRIYARNVSHRETASAWTKTFMAWYQSTASAVS